MKKLILILFSIYFSNQATSQFYQFSKSMGTYADLSNPIILRNTAWSTLKLGINLPFTFKYWGVGIGSSIYIDDKCSISLTSSTSQEVTFMFDKVVNRNGNSSINYSVEGSTPNRILKIEYKNIGLYMDSLGHPDSASMQYWLYETTNEIEFRYGPNSVKASSFTFPGIFVGLLNSTSTKIINLGNNPANPTVNTTNLTTPSFLNGLPEAGTIYKFSPTLTGINKIATTYKINTGATLTTTMEGIKSVIIYNTTGQMLQKTQTLEEVDISNLPHGIYLIAIETKEQNFVQKIIL